METGGCNLGFDGIHEYLGEDCYHCEEEAIDSCFCNKNKKHF